MTDHIPEAVGPHVTRTSATTMVAWAMWALALTSYAIAVATTQAGGPNDPVAAIVQGLGIFPAITVGAVLAARLPRNLIGWLLLVAGLFYVVTGAATGLADYFGVNQGGVPVAIWFAWLSGWTFVPFVVLALVYLPLLFPTGRLLSSRWRVVAWGAAVAGVAAMVQSAVAPFTPGEYPAAVQNPLLVNAGGTVGDIATMVGNLSLGVIVVALLLAMASLVIRYRRASGIERQQLKWFGAVIGIAGPALAIALVTSNATSGIWVDVSNVTWAIGLVGLALLPIAVGIAVLRYRLYDIDLVIRRTLVYGVLAALLAAAYGGSVLLLSAVLAPLTAENSLAVAGSTLVVAALFSPVRTRVKSVVDRRFYRSRYDARHELAELSQRLLGEVDLEGVRSEVVATIERTLQPASVSVWLIGRSEKPEARANPTSAWARSRSSG